MGGVEEHGQGEGEYGGGYEEVGVVWGGGGGGRTGYMGMLKNMGKGEYGGGGGGGGLDMWGVENGGG